MSNIEKFKKDPYTRRFNVGPDYKEDEIDNWSTSTAESGSFRNVGAVSMIGRNVKISSVETDSNTSARQFQTPFQGKSIAAVTPATEEYNNGDVRQSATFNDSNIDTPQVFHPRHMALSDSFDSTSFTPGKSRSQRTNEVSGSDEVLRDSKSNAKDSRIRPLTSSLNKEEIVPASVGLLRRSQDSTGGYIQKVQDISMMSMTSSQELEYQLKITTYQKDIEDMLRIRDTMTEQLNLFKNEKTLLLKKIDRLEDENDRLVRAQEDSKVLEKMLRDKVEIQSWSNVEGLNQELEALRTENEKLREQVDSVDLIAENLGKEIDKLELSKDQLTSEAKALREDNIQLVSALEQSKVEQKLSLESWEQRVNELQSTNQSVNAELLAAQQTNKSTVEELVVLRSELEVQVSLMAEKESRFEQTLTKLNDDLNTALSQVDSHRLLLDSQAKEFEQSIRESQQQWQLEKKVFLDEAAKSSELQLSIKSELDLLRKNMTSHEITLNDQLKLLNSQAVEQQQKIVDLTSELERAEGLLQRNEDRVKSSQEEILQLQEKLAALQKSLAVRTDELQTAIRQHELDTLELNHLRDWKSKHQIEAESLREEATRHLSEELQTAERKLVQSEEKSRTLSARIDSLQAEAQIAVRNHALVVSELEVKHAEAAAQLQAQLSEAHSAFQKSSRDFEQRILELQNDLTESRSSIQSVDQMKHTKQLEVEKSLREELRQTKTALYELEAEHRDLQATYTREMQAKSDELIALSVSLGDLRAKLEASETSRGMIVMAHEASGGLLSVRSSIDHSVQTSASVAIADANAAVSEEVAELQLKLNEVRKKYYQIKNDHHEEVKRIKYEHNRELSELRISSKTDIESLKRDLAVLQSRLGSSSKDHQSTVDELHELKNHLFGVEQEVVKSRLETTNLSNENGHLKKKIKDLSDDLMMNADQKKHLESLIEPLKLQLAQGNVVIDELKAKAKKTKADVKSYMKNNNSNLLALKDLLRRESAQGISATGPGLTSSVTSLPSYEEEKHSNLWNDVMPLVHDLVDRKKKLEIERDNDHAVARQQVKDLQRALKLKEDDLLDAQMETQSTYSTQSQAVVQLQSKLQSTLESNAGYQREIEDLLSKLESEQRKRFDLEDHCAALEAMKTEILSQQVTLVQESDSATLELRKLMDQKEAQLKKLEEEKKSLTHDLNMAQSLSSALSAKIESQESDREGTIALLRDELKHSQDSADKQKGEWQMERSRLERDLSRVTKDLQHVKQEKQAMDLRCSGLARDILSTLQSMPLSNSSTNKSVTSTPYSSVEKGDLEVMLKSVLDVATLKSMTLYETLEQQNKSGKLLKQEIEQYSESFVHLMERVLDEETSSSTDSSTSGAADVLSRPTIQLVSTAHINKYPHLSQPENRDLNQSLIRLEQRVLDAVFQAENARSYLGVEVKKVNSLQNQLNQARDTISDLERQLAAVQEYAASVNEEQHQQVLQEGLEMKQELQKYSGTIAELQESRGEAVRREKELKLSLNEACAKLTALESQFNDVVAENKQLTAYSSDQLKQFNAASSEVHQLKLSNAQSAQKIQLLEVEIESLRKSIMEVSAEKDALALKVSSTDSQAATLKLTQDSLQRLKSQLESDVIQLRNENETLSKSYTSTLHEKRQWEFQSQQLNQTLATLKTALTERETEHATLTAALSQSQTTSEQLKADVWSLTKDKQSLGLQVQGLQSELENHKIALESAKLSTAAIETQLASVKDENNSYSVLFAESQKEMVAMKQSMTLLTQELVALKDRSHELIELDDARHQLVVNKQALNETKLLLSDAMKDNSTLESQLFAAFENEKSLKSQLDTVNEQLTQVIRDSKSTQVDLEGIMRRNDDLNAKVQSLTSQLDLRQSSHREIEKQLFDVSTHRLDLEQQLVAKTLELESLQDFHLKDKQAMIDEFTEEIREYEQALIRATVKQKDVESEHSTVLLELSSLRSELESVMSIRNQTIVEVNEMTQRLIHEEQQHSQLKERHRALRGEVDSLTMQLNNAEVFFTEYKASHTDYTNQLQSTNLELKSALSSNGQLIEEKEYLTKLLDSINNDFKAGQREIQQLQTQLHLLEQKLSVTTDREKMYTQNQESFAEERAVWEKQLKKSDDEVKLVRNQLHESRSEGRDKERVIADLKNELSMTQNRVQQLEKEKVSIQAELMTKNSELQNTSADLARLVSDLKRTQAELETVRREMLNQSDKASLLLTERDESQRLGMEFRRQIGDLQRELQGKTVQLTRTEESNVQYSNEVLQLQQQLSTSSSELSSSLNEIKSLEQDVKHLEAQVSALTKRESEQLVSIERLNGLNHDLRDELAMQQTALRDAESKLKSLHSTRGDSNRREAKLEERIEELLKENTNLSSARDSLQSKTKNLEYKLRDRNASLQSAEKEIVSLTSRLAEVESELSEERKRSLGLVQDLDESTLDLSKLMGSVQSLQRRHEDQVEVLESEIEGLRKECELWSDRMQAKEIEWETKTKLYLSGETQKERDYASTLQMWQEKDRVAQAELRTLGNRIAECERDLQQSSSVSGAEIDRLALSVKKLTEEAELKKQELSVAEKECSRVSKLLEAAQAAGSNAQSLHEALSQDLKAAQDRLADLEAVLLDLRGVNAALSAESESLKRSQLKSEAELSEMMATHSMEMADKESKISLLTSTLDSVTQQLNNERSAGLQVSTQLSLSQTAVDELSRHVQAQAFKLQEQLTVNDELSTALEAMKAEKEALESHHKERVISLVEDLASANDLLSTVEGEIQKSHEGHTGLENELTVVKNSLSSLESIHSKVSDEFVRAKAELESVKQSLATLHETHAQEKNEYQSNLDSLNSVIVHYRTELQSLQTSSSEAIDLLNNSLRFLLISLSQIHLGDKSLSQQLMDVLNGGETITASALSEVASVVEKIVALCNALRADLNQATSLNQSLKSNIDDLTVQLQIAQNQNSSTVSELSRLRTEGSSTTTVVTTLTSQLSEKTEQVEAHAQRIRLFESMMEHNDDIIAQLKNSNQSLQYHCETVVAELAMAKDRIGSLENSLNNSQNVTVLFGKQEQELREQRERIEELLVEIKDLKSRETRLADEVESSGSKMTSIQASKLELQSEIELLTVMNLKQQQDIEMLKRDLHEAQRDQGILVHDNKQLRSAFLLQEEEKTQLSVMLENKNDALHDLTQELNHVYKRINQFHDAILGIDTLTFSNSASGLLPVDPIVATASTQSKLQNINDLFHNIRKRHGQLLQDYKKLCNSSVAESQLSDLRSAHQLEDAKMISELQRLVRMFDSVSSSGVSVSNDKETLLTFISDKLSALTSEVSMLQQTHGEVVNRMTAESGKKISELSMQISNQSFRMQQLEDSVSHREHELRSELTRIMTERTDLLELLESLQAEGRTRESELATCLKELESMRGRDIRTDKDLQYYQYAIKELNEAVQQLEGENANLRKERDALLDEKQRIQSSILEFDNQLSQQNDDALDALNETRKSPSKRSNVNGMHSMEIGVKTTSTATRQGGATVTQSNLDLEGDIMGGFEKLLKERRRLRRTCSSQQLCILSLRLLLKEAELAKANSSTLSSSSEPQSPLGPIQIRN